MAWHTITRACGHQEREQFYGPHRDREWKVARAEERDCSDCWQKARDRERAAAVAEASRAAAEAGMPSLEGTEKQIAWAETIRAEMLSDLTRCEPRVTLEQRAHLETAAGFVRAQSSARWFIDNRDDGPYSLMEQASVGKFDPATPQQEAMGFNPLGRNSVTFDSEDVVAMGDPFVVLRFTRSRWEGCTVSVYRSMTERHDDGSLTVTFTADQRFGISDGRRERVETAERLVSERAERTDDPGARVFWEPSAFKPGDWNEFDVPEADVEANGKTVRVTLTNSRWEGLHFDHPASLAFRHRPGFVSLRFGPDWVFKVLGGERMMRISLNDMWDDRANPLTQSGPSQAVEQKSWHAVEFHRSHVRVMKSGRSVMLRFSIRSPYPEAVTFHPKSLCRSEEYGATARVSFHEDWEFLLRTRDGAEVPMTAEDFIAATLDWAGHRLPRGEHVVSPVDLLPTAAEIDPDLLDLTEDAS